MAELLEIVNRSDDKVAIIKVLVTLHFNKKFCNCSCNINFLTFSNYTHEVLWWEFHIK